MSYNKDVGIFLPLIGLATLIYLSVPYFTKAQPFALIDATNLIIHEAGHVIFGFLGVFGGTFFQLFVPVLMYIYFMKTHQVWAMIFCLWWLGVNVVNVGIYMADANARMLPLVGDGTHDWTTMFSNWGVLTMSEWIGNSTKFIGQLFIVTALISVGVKLLKSIVSDLNPI